MTTFEKAMMGDERAIEQFFFTKSGSTRSDEEARIIFNFDLHHTERLQRIAAIREAKSFQHRRSNGTTPETSYITFDNLIVPNDTSHTAALGVQLA